MRRTDLVLLASILALALIPACGDEGGGSADGGNTGPASAGPGAGAAAKGQLTAVVEEYLAATKAGDVDRVFATFSTEMTGAMEKQMTYLGDNPREMLGESWRKAAAGMEYTVAGEEFGRFDHLGVPSGQVVVQSVGNDRDDELTFTLLKREGKWGISVIESRNQAEEARRALEEMEKNR